MIELLFIMKLATSSFQTSSGVSNLADLLLLHYWKLPTIGFNAWKLERK